tara:strand:- start:1202 stop:2116 length:915 start_codon:yes stop_codon:yes gene_type:complete
MKFLKFSMLMTYFALEKNSKRALLIINVGIFLSIFACSAAFISLYIENKVSQFEFLHLEESKYKREAERTIQLIPSITGELRQVVNIEDTNQEFSELMRFNNFGKLIISSNDIQASGLYEITYTIKDFDEYMEIFDLYVKDEKYLKEVLPVYHEEFKQLVKETKKNLNILRKLEDKEKIFENILYNRSYDDLFDELLVSLKESTKKKQNLKFIGEYSKEFLLAEKIVDQFYELIEYALLITSSSITYSDIALKDINNEIKYFSKLEKNLILSAFILQLSIFIIIQFFEISSVNFNLKRIRKKIK